MADVRELEENLRLVSQRHSSGANAYPFPGLTLLGDIVGLSIFGKPIIVLNSRHAIKELLVKRSAIYSDRPKLIMLRQW